MTQELKEQLARDYADSTTPFGDHGGNNWRAAYNGYLAALNARDEEIERLNKKCNFAIERLRKAHEEIASFRNPWISVKEQLPVENQDILISHWNENVTRINCVSTGDINYMKEYPNLIKYWMLTPKVKRNESK